MTAIKNKIAYSDKNPISDNDFLVGTNGDTIKKETKSFPVHLLRDYLMQGLSPETGGTLKVTEIVYEGVLTTPEEVANALNHSHIIQRYEVVILNVNGDKYQLKLQNIVIGLIGTPVTNDDFIPISLVAENLSESISFYKGYNSTTGREEHYSIGSVGFSITKELDGLNETGKILLEQTEQTNLGTGLPIYKGFNNTTKKQEFYNVKSNNLTVELVGGDLVINTPSTAYIPALYVNDLYIPTYNDWLVENKLQNGGTAILGFIFRGKGTIAQPFTNNTVYPLAGGSATTTSDTAIQNALDGDSAYTIPYSYVGSTALSYSRLNPQRSGQKIIIQDNTTFYNFHGDFNYENINIKLQGYVVATTTGYLIDMDNAAHFNASNGKFLITIENEYILQLTDSLGFRNSGNNSSTLPSYDTGRIGLFLGEGTIYFSYNGADILTRYIFTGEGNNNDDNLHFQVQCKVRADQQGIYLTKNKMRIDFYNQLQSGVLLGSGNINLKACHMTGGQIRFYDKGGATIQNGVTGRLYGFTFEPEDDGIGYTIFQLNSAQVAGSAEGYFAKLNNEHVSFLAFNSPSGDGFATVLAGTVTVINGLFENLGVDRWNVEFKNNVFSYTGIDQTKVDLTRGNEISAINFIGNDIIENLVVFASKADALASGHPINSAFKKRNVFNAGSFKVGVEYKIVTVGTTNFTLIGASANTVGLFFTATGVGLGTGTASLETREILT